MRYPLIAQRLYGTPLLLHPDKAAVIESVFRAYAAGGVPAVPEGTHVPRPEAVAYAAPRFADKPYTLTEAGVAVLPIFGTLVQRGSGLDAMSGITGYTRIERQLASALADPDVRGILLELDSPGGEASGVFDLAALISGAAKPVWACANEMAHSGAYALAAASQRITLPRTARVGSVGVIAMFVDQSKRDASQGYAYTAVFAGARKNDGNPHEPLSSPARKRLQGMVDGLYTLFVEHVAAERRMSVEAVRATEAATFSAEEAVAVGFADAVQSFNDTLAEFEAHVSKPQGVSTTGGFRLTQGAAMKQAQATTADPNPAAASVTDPGRETTAPAPATSVAAPETPAPAGDAVAAERARIEAITTCAEASGRAALAQHLAFKTAMSADDAKALLAAAPKEAAAAAAPANALAAAMAAVPNPAVGADAPAPNPQATGAGWDRAFTKVGAPLRAVK